MARRHVNTTKFEIIRTATRLFLEVGYSATTPKRICEELDISTGNLTYYFPTKEHLLTELVEMLCEYQRELLQEQVEEGRTSLLAVCLELATMAAAAEEDAVAKELFLASYTSPMCLEIIQKSDTRRSMEVYAPYCPEWTQQQFVEAELLVSGVEYATLSATSGTAPLEVRIAGALNNIMQIYNVPEDVRKVKIRKILSLDYRKMGRKILEQFRAFVDETNEHTFEALLGGKEA